MKFHLLILFFTIFWQILSAQEVVSKLPLLPNHSNKNTKKSNQQKIIKLPFFDDFSTNKTYPNPEIWQDDDVLINNNYAIGMPSLGVATFDAVNAKGEHYHNASSNPYRADKLTSQIIDLEKADTQSLWLSFYYQPQGYGNAPEKEDSLIVEVTTDGKKWKKVWGTEGSSFEEFGKKILKLNLKQNIDTNAFKLVMIPLKEKVYKTNKFQFRFVNYASLSGKFNLETAINSDHWNIDYVYLNDHRSETDTIFKDVAFVKPPNSFLRYWQSVPWRHYREVQKQELSKEFLHIRNNYNQVLNVKQTEILFKDLKSNQMIDSFNISQITANPFENQSIDWKFDGDPLFKSKNSKELSVQLILRLDTDDTIKNNNIATQNYHFKNYYAYDDGSAENAYGIDATGAKVAYRFKSYLPDTLKAISMYFLQTQPKNEGLMSFSLCVWESNEGKPGKLLLEDKGISPVFSEKINQFKEYKLSKGIAVNGEFFIGWVQKDKRRINIGFDNNTNSKIQLFYNIYGSWQNSEANGSLMLRPILGHLTTSSTNDYKYSKKQKIRLYPNPTNQIVYFEGLEHTKDIIIIEIYNLQGVKISSTLLADNFLDVSFLNNGVYLVCIKIKNKISQTKRLIIAQ